MAVKTKDELRADLALILTDGGKLTAAEDRALRTDLIDTMNVSTVSQASLTILSGEVRTLFSSPILLVPAPGEGYAIKVCSWCVEAIEEGTPYATNTTLVVITDSASVAQGQETEILKSTAKRIVNGNIRDVAGADPGATQILNNRDLLLTVSEGDPVSGTFAIKVYVTYEIIQLG